MCVYISLTIVCSDRLQVSEKEVRLLTSKLRFLEKEVEKHEVKHAEDEDEKENLRTRLGDLEQTHVANLEYKDGIVLLCQATNTCNDVLAVLSSIVATSASSVRLYFTL